MKSTFSERIGLKKKKKLKKDEISIELRNNLWSIFSTFFLNRFNDIERYSGAHLSLRASFYKSLWMDFYKRPIDELDIRNGVIYSSSHYSYVRNWFFKAKWNEVYDLIEYGATYDRVGKSFRKECNYYLKRELAAYRFIGEHLIEVNSKEETIEIEKVLESHNKYRPVQIHIESAIKSMSNKTSDYRNSIKESISAVESCCNILLESDNKTLGQALKEIQHIFHIPRGIKNGFSSIYGYASHEDGIRHGLTVEAKDVNIEEARFMLITCSAFINYILSKSEGK